MNIWWQLFFVESTVLIMDTQSREVKEEIDQTRGSLFLKGEKLEIFYPHPLSCLNYYSPYNNLHKIFKKGLPNFHFRILHQDVFSQNHLISIFLRKRQILIFNSLSIEEPIISFIEQHLFTSVSANLSFILIKEKLKVGFRWKIRHLTN